LPTKITLFIDIKLNFELIMRLLRKNYNLKKIKN